MATIQYSGLVTQIKGSIGGSTFQSNRNGFSIRNKPIPRNPQSATQQQVRGLIGYLSQYWRTLSDSERDSWNAVVNSWPAVDAYGNPVVLSGYSIFLSANTGLSICGSPISKTGLLPSVLQTLSTPAMVISISAGTALWSWTGGNVAADMVVTLSSTQMMSQGRSFRRTGFKVIKRLLPTDPSPEDVWSKLLTLLGQPPIVGSRIWFSMRVYSSLSGNSSLVLPFSAIVQA